jgi:hypothetical protein
MPKSFRFPEDNGHGATLPSIPPVLKKFFNCEALSEAIDLRRRFNPRAVGFGIANFHSGSSFSSPSGADMNDRDRGKEKLK